MSDLKIRTEPLAGAAAGVVGGAEVVVRLRWAAGAGFASEAA
jgi:hypothetical protein